MITHLVSRAYSHTPQTDMPASFVALSHLRTFIPSLTFKLPNFKVNSHKEWLEELAPEPYSLPNFIAIFLAVCLALAVTITFINGFGRVRGYHLILQAGRVPEVFDAYRDEEDSYAEATSPVVAGVSAHLSV